VKATNAKVTPERRNGVYHQRRQGNCDDGNTETNVRRESASKLATENAQRTIDPLDSGVWAIPIARVQAPRKAPRALKATLTDRRGLRE